MGFKDRARRMVDRRQKGDDSDRQPSGKSQPPTVDGPAAYPFAAAPDLARDELVGLLGGKAAGLVEMTLAGLPVPPGFSLTTEACRRFLAAGWQPDFDAAIAEHMAALEAETGKQLGSAEHPLLVSVRSGAPISMPGMMDTILNVGMNDDTEAGLAAMTGDPDFAADTYCRFLSTFTTIVLDGPPATLASAAVLDSPVMVRATLAEAGLDVPTDPIEQITAAVKAVFQSWIGPRAERYRAIEHIDAELGTAATVQAMVFGNLGEDSGTGVAFTRDPSTGKPGLMGDFMVRAQGEDVVAGDHATLDLGDLADQWPACWAELAATSATLERTYREMMDIEFTVEQGKLWILQARIGKRSPLAALRIAIDMAEDADFPLDRADAVGRCERYFDDPPTIAAITEDAEGSRQLDILASGLGASPGTASGVLCTDVDEAVRLASEGVDVILARKQTSPADVHGMAAAKGIFTTLGGKVSHAAVVARSWGTPAVVGATEAEVHPDAVVGPGGRADVGTLVTVDGDRGVLMAGTIETAAVPAPEALTLRRWASELADEQPADGPSAGDSSGDRAIPMMSDEEEIVFPILHSLRIKGMAKVDAIGAMIDVRADEVARHLDRLASGGHVRFLDKLELWQLTPEGSEAHGEALAAQVQAFDLGALPYEQFLALNTQFKQLCTDWQLRDGEPNDHSDADYDTEIVSRLADHDSAAATTLDEMSAVIGWLAPYPPRLAAAVERLQSGDEKALTGVMCDSYHDIWMELHEDLILTQGLDRVAEGSG